MARAVLLLAIEALHSGHELGALFVYCRSRQHEIVAITSALFAAYRMIEDGDADVIVASPDLPFPADPPIEIARDDGGEDGPRRPRLIWAMMDR